MGQEEQVVIIETISPLIYPQQEWDDPHNQEYKRGETFVRKKRVVVEILTTRIDNNNRVRNAIHKVSAQISSSLGRGRGITPAPPPSGFGVHTGWNGFGSAVWFITRVGDNGRCDFLTGLCDDLCGVWCVGTTETNS